MRRELLPLLLASDRFAPEEPGEPLDRLRMQKGVFLLQQRGSERWSELFDFEPYDWGPFSRDLATTVADLVDRELLVKDRLPHRRYGHYRTSPRGERIVEIVTDKLSPAELSFIAKVRRFVATRSFSQLLRDVYAAYPDYAVNSRFAG